MIERRDIGIGRGQGGTAGLREGVMRESYNQPEVRKFKVGDTVVLKSGGPLMTIKQINKDDDTFQCCWFGTYQSQSGRILFDSQAQNTWFHKDQLLLAKYTAGEITISA